MDRPRPACTRRGRSAVATLGAIVAIALLPALAAAHPLGNFTINHYAEVRVELDRVLLDVVIDHAEIPTFQERAAFDTDGDGSISDAEIEAGRSRACAATAAELELSADGQPLELRTLEAGLSFPQGVGGLPTMRLVCGLSAPLPAPVGAEPVRIAFRDPTFAGRIGWREIVARGSGVTLAIVDGEGRDASVSDRLTSYPADRLATPLADLGSTVDATAGGALLPAFDLPDAEPVDGGIPPAASAPPAAGSPGPVESPDATPSGEPGPTAPVSPTDGVVPGGIGGGELPDIFLTADLTPIVVLLSLAVAVALGAGHAVTPGHGKTLMAAYLVGTRGTPLHALGLGLSVSVSHTIGILVLAALVVGASDVLPPDALIRVAPLVAALSILAIGGWMLAVEWRRRRAAAPPDHGHEPGHDHDHGHEHDHGHDEDHVHDHVEPGTHAHGGIRHSHLPVAGSTITWRSLFALGLAGGLIPSTSALLILLGAIAAGRPAFGFVLVVAFGIGMAAVMSGIGLALVVARARLDRLPSGGALDRVRGIVPLAAASVVFGFGILLTAQALDGALTL